MSNQSALPYIGCKMRVISKLDIRYEGILSAVNTTLSTIVLVNVRSLGVEFNQVIFKSSDIKDLTVYENSKAQTVGLPPSNSTSMTRPESSQSATSSHSNTSVGSANGISAAKLAIQEHLKIGANRSRLIVLSNTPMDEDNCMRTLLLYGAIRKLRLSSDRLAAFVDFECEHAPLLVARCYKLYRRNPEIPMPEGITLLLPGCSINNYLYLQDVPRTLPSCRIQEHLQLSDENVVYRPGATTDLSSVAVIKLTSTQHTFYAKDGIRRFSLLINGKYESFCAISRILQLTDFGGITESAGCEQCNVAALRDHIELEDRKWAERGATAEVCAPPPKIDDDDNRTPKDNSPPSRSAVVPPLMSIPVESRMTPLRNGEAPPSSFPFPPVSTPSLVTSVGEEKWDDVPEGQPFTPVKKDEEMQKMPCSTPTPPDPTQTRHKSMRTTTVEVPRSHPVKELSSSPSPSPSSIPSMASLSLDGYTPPLLLGQRRERGEEVKEESVTQLQVTRPVMVQQGVVMNEEISRSGQKQERDGDIRFVADSATAKVEDVIDEESERLLNGRKDDVIVEESAGEMKKASDVIVEESEPPVVGKEDVVVEESTDAVIDEPLELIENQNGEAKQSDNVAVEESAPPMNGEEDVVVEEHVDTGEVSVEVEGDDSEYASSVFYEAEEDPARDSDDLLSGEEDQWMSVGRHTPSPLPRVLSIESLPQEVKERENTVAYGFAAGDAPSCVMTMKEEVDDTVRDIVDRMVEATSDTVDTTHNNGISTERAGDIAERTERLTEHLKMILNPGGEAQQAGDVIVEESEAPVNGEEDVVDELPQGTIDSSTVPAKLEDKVYCSDEETITYDDTFSDDNTISDDSSDRDGSIFVDPEEWDEEDRIKYGYMPRQPLSTIDEDSQEEDTVSPVTSIEEVISSEEGEKMESIDGEEDTVEKGVKIDGYCDEEISDIDSDKENTMEKEEGAEQRVVVSSTIPVVTPDVTPNEQAEEKTEVRQRAPSTTSTVLIWRSGSEMDSDDEVEEGTVVDKDEERNLEIDDSEEETENDERVANPIPASINNIDVGASEQTDEKMEQREFPPASLGLHWRRENEVDSDDEEEEGEATVEEVEKEGEGEATEGDEVKEEGEMTVEEKEGEEVKTEDVIDEEKKEEVRTEDVIDEEKKEEESKTQRATPIRRWSRTKVVDDEDEEHGTSEYNDWLTRDEGLGVSMRDSSEGFFSSDSDSELREREMVPLPSTLPSSSWGKGIEIEKRKRPDDLITPLTDKSSAMLSALMELEDFD